MLIKDIIKQAYYEGAVIALGAEPSDLEYSIALERLNSLVLSLFGTEIATTPDIQAVDGTIKNYFTVPEVDTTYIIHMSGAFKLNLPIEGIYDGCTVRAVQLGTATSTLTVISEPFMIGNDFSATYQYEVGQKPTSHFWFFRADIASWYYLTTLTLDAESPLPPEFNDFLICWLSTRLSAVNGADPRQGTLNALNAGMQKLKVRYSSTKDITFDESPHNTRQAFSMYMDMR